MSVLAMVDRAAASTEATKTGTENVTRLHPIYMIAILAVLGIVDSGLVFAGILSPEVWGITTFAGICAIGLAWIFGPNPA